MRYEPFMLQLKVNQICLHGETYNSKISIKLNIM